MNYFPQLSITISTAANVPGVVLALEKGLTLSATPLVMYRHLGQHLGNVEVRALFQKYGMSLSFNLSAAFE